MAKYQSRIRAKPVEQPRYVDPMWSLIGCAMMILVPLISFAGAYLTLQMVFAMQWPVTYIPRQLLGYPKLPNFIQSVTPGLVPLLTPITQIANLYSYIVLGVIYILFLGGLVSFVYALFHRFTGGTHMGPLDVPRPKGVKVKKYTR